MGHTRDYGTFGTYQEMWGIVGFGETYQDLGDLVGHTRTCGTWWDVPRLAGLGGTCQDLGDLVGHTRTWWDIPGHVVLPGFAGLMWLNGVLDICIY